MSGGEGERLPPVLWYGEMPYILPISGWRLLFSGDSCIKNQDFSLTLQINMNGSMNVLKGQVLVPPAKIQAAL